jgi:hypothetical protein
VSEFIYEIEEIINMIGLIDEREKVIQLWEGLQPVIKKGLWQDGYNPEVSTWDQVKHAAQVIELSEEVSGEVQEHQSNPDRISYISGMVSLGGRRGGRNSYRNNQNRSSRNRNRSNYSRNGYRGNNGNGNPSRVIAKTMLIQTIIKLIALDQMIIELVTIVVPQDITREMEGPRTRMVN